MTKYLVICDKCGKEIKDSYIRIKPEPCLKEKSPIIANTLSKQLDICLDCWKGFLERK